MSCSKVFGWYLSIHIFVEACGRLRFDGEKVEGDENDDLDALPGGLFFEDAGADEEGEKEAKV